MRQLHPDGFLEDRTDHALEHRANLFLGQKRSLNIDLGEFRLTVSAQIFIAEAFGDLVVAVVAGHHQQLLEQLGRLGQRKKLAIVHTAGHEVVACAFGGALGQHRGFDVNESVFVEILAHFHGHAVAQHQVVLHIGTAQVKHPVCQAGGLRKVLIIELERGCHRGVEHFQGMTQHFDLAGHQVGVFGACRAGAYLAYHFEAKLVAHALGRLEHVCAIGVTNDLHKAFSVTQINKDHAAMVAAAMGPAHQGHGLVHQRFADQTAVSRSHGCTPVL